MTTHYGTHELDHEQKVRLLRSALAAASAWWVDRLDCRISPIRENVEMSVEQALALFTPGTPLTVIHRQHENVLEVGFRVSDTERPMVLDWFLFVLVPYPAASSLIAGAGLVRD